jgi:UDP-glucose 4-epimerase
LQTRDYVYVGDVVKAALTTINDEASDIYNIGTGIETDVNQLFHIINNIAGKGLVEKHGPPARGEQMRSVITSDKIFAKFKWRPTTKLEEGLKNTVNFFKERMEAQQNK